MAKEKKAFTVDSFLSVGKIELGEGTILRARINTTDNVSKLDVRVWYKTKKMDEYLPTGKGVSLDIDKLESLEKMIAKAKKLVKQNKLTGGSDD